MRQYLVCLDTIELRSILDWHSVQDEFEGLEGSRKKVKVAKLERKRKWG